MQFSAVEYDSQERTQHSQLCQLCRILVMFLPSSISSYLSVRKAKSLFTLLFFMFMKFCFCVSFGFVLIASHRHAYFSDVGYGSPVREVVPFTCFFNVMILI